MASSNSSRSHSPTHPSDFDFDSTFTEISILVAYAEQYAHGLNLKVRNHRKSSFTAKDWPFSEPFPEVKVTLRGEILCSPKSDGRVLGSKCKWKLVYKFHKSKMAYIWLHDSCIMKHDHCLAPNPVTLDGCHEVNYEKDLTPSEYQFIKEHSLMRIQIPMLMVNLEREFAHRSFDAKMVCRIKDKTLNERYGSDRKQLHELFIQGSDVRRLGGIFEIVPSQEFGIESLHFQTAMMRRYAIVYGVNDLKMCDATHHLTQHDRVTIVWNIIDGLQRTKLAGVSYSPSENHAPIIQSALYFFPGESFKDGKWNESSIEELSNVFDPKLCSVVSLQCNQSSAEQCVHPSGYETPINSDEECVHPSGSELPIKNANQRSISHTSSPTKTPPMTMGVSAADPSITKYTVPVTHVKCKNHRSFGVSLQILAETNQVIISKVVKGSLADQLFIEVRDELISVNSSIDLKGQDIYTAYESCVCELFQPTNPQELTLELKRSTSPRQRNSNHPTVSY